MKQTNRPSHHPYSPKCNEIIEFDLGNTRKHAHASEYSIDGAICGCDAFNGRNRAPNKALFNTIAARSITEFLQPYASAKYAMNGEKMHVPSPDPATATPFFFLI